MESTWPNSQLNLYCYLIWTALSTTAMHLQFQAVLFQYLWPPVVLPWANLICQACL